MKAQTTRFITGLLIVVVGIGFLLGNFDIINFKDIVMDWWPLAIIVRGYSDLYQ